MARYPHQTQESPIFASRKARIRFSFCFHVSSTGVLEKRRSIPAPRTGTSNFSRCPRYTPDHFLDRIRFRGITPSLAFVAEPETKGVTERFHRTLREQAIYGRAFQPEWCMKPSRHSSGATRLTGVLGSWAFSLPGSPTVGLFVAGRLFIRLNANTT